MYGGLLAASGQIGSKMGGAMGAGGAGGAAAGGAAGGAKKLGGMDKMMERMFASGKSGGGGKMKDKFAHLNEYSKAPDLSQLYTTERALGLLQPHMKVRPVQQMNRAPSVRGNYMRSLLEI